MTDKEFLVSQLMRLGYSQGEAEAIVARNEIASSLVRQGIPLERALAIANQMVGSTADTPDGRDSLSTQADVAGFAQGMQAQRGEGAPVTGGIAPGIPGPAVGPVTSGPLGPPSAPTSFAPSERGDFAQGMAAQRGGPEGLAGFACRRCAAQRGGQTAAPNAPTQSEQRERVHQGRQGRTARPRAGNQLTDECPAGGNAEHRL